MSVVVSFFVLRWFLKSREALKREWRACTRCTCLQDNLLYYKLYRETYRGPYPRVPYSQVYTLL